MVRDEIGGLIDELVINTKKVAIAASREIEKWRRWIKVVLNVGCEWLKGLILYLLHKIL